MQQKKNQMSVGLMIQRCHRWRQKRKQYMDAARQTPDEIERERLFQMAEHYGRIVAEEQGKIDSTRDPRDKTPNMPMDNDTSDDDDDDNVYPDFLAGLK